MTSIPQKELRNNIGEVLRRAEAGERLTITVAGRPVALLGPAPRRQWVDAQVLRNLPRVSSPGSLLEDLEDFPGGLADPFE